MGSTEHDTSNFYTGIVTKSMWLFYHYIFRTLIKIYTIQKFSTISITFGYLWKNQWFNWIQSDVVIESQILTCGSGLTAANISNFTAKLRYQSTLHSHCIFSRGSIVQCVDNCSSLRNVLVLLTVTWLSYLEAQLATCTQLGALQGRIQ